MYDFLQSYWWFLISLLAALLVFLLFVQGGQSLLWNVGKSEEQRQMLLLATGRKWEITFTTLVLFGGAFFAAFPLFYACSFGGAYWLWMLLLFCFVLQAVSYEFQRKKGNLLGCRSYRIFLFLNGVLAPLLLGCAIGSFFGGADFIIDRNSLCDPAMPVVARWANGLRGLELLLQPWNLCLGFALLFLSRVLALLYLLNNVADGELRVNCRRAFPRESLLLLLFLLPYLAHWLSMSGCAYEPASGLCYMRECHYLDNLRAMPSVAVVMALGVLLLLLGLLRPLMTLRHAGIWLAGAGSVLTVLAMLLCAGWNHSCYYPSSVNLQSSLHLANSCSSEFSLKVMAVVSLLIPFVLAYIIRVWQLLEKEPISAKELRREEVDEESCLNR